MDEELEVDEELDDEDLDEESTEVEEDDEEADEPAVDLKALMARLDKQDAVNTQLTQAVSRFQGLQAKNEAASRPDPKVVAAQETAMDEVYDLLNALVDGADDAFIEPSVKSRAAQALAARNTRRADRVIEERVRTMVAEAVGTRPAGDGGSGAPQFDVASAVAQLEADLVGEITSYGLDPDDFDWTKAQGVLATSGPDGLRTHIRTQIRAAIADDSRASRRQSRKANVGNRPKGGTTAASGEAVMDGTDEKAKREFLRSLGIAGV